MPAALCSVVTESVLDEFLVLRFSYELFHGCSDSWFIRCDQESAAVLAAYPRTSCAVFSPREPSRPDHESAAFRRIVAQKMNAIEDAWAAGRWNRVAFMDADLVFAAPLSPGFDDMKADVSITPNYYPANRMALKDIHGMYNAGFIVTTTPDFHRWWRDTFEAHPSSWTDQACLNVMSDRFRVAELGEDTNVGFWRSNDLPHYRDVPRDPRFVHVHLYQPLATWREWVDRSFALHCLRLWEGSARGAHKRIVEEILKRDRHGWYEASLKLCAAIPHAGAA